VAAARRTGGNGNGRTLTDRKLYIPQMAYAGGNMIAAAFRSIGIDATIAPDSDHRSLELGGLHASGEECLPHKITLGDFLKICREPGFDPKSTAFFMPTSHGPCRFGQYAVYLRQELTRLGYGDVLVVSPSTGDSYEGFRKHAGELMRTMWMGAICGDLVTKFLYKTRPYETEPGTTDRVYRKSVDELAAWVARRDLTVRERYRGLVGLIEQMRDRYRAVPARYIKGRPFIGIVGEIFCRLNDFANDDTARRVEQLGGEVRMAEFSEWIWYTNWCQAQAILDEKGRFSAAYLKYKIKNAVQRRYLNGLLAPVHDDLAGYEECDDINEVLDAARPYLPPEGCAGEMVLSIGQAHVLHRAGGDGVIDISPFTCMNGITCEAIYPAVSATLCSMPIRSLYFDGTNTHLDSDLEIFLDLARAYQKRKPHQRTYPDFFE
jgi:predicted nucleotide-binding protein (sugar kinase/HSP70/actin superfamily)